jgi:hypothetical protein
MGPNGLLPVDASNAKLQPSIHTREFSMKITASKVILALSLATAFGAAHANQIYNFGLLNTSKSFNDLGGDGAFIDTFTFSVAGNASVAGSLLVTVYGDVPEVAMSALVGAHWSPAQPLPMTYDSGTETYAFSSQISGFLAGNTYQFQVASHDVFYNVNLSPVVAAVPEPESYAMLLAGLGLVGAIVRRRKSTVAQIGA